MGMPGSETAVGELLCRILGDLLLEGIVAKLADDIYCGGNTFVELQQNARRLLQCFANSGLRLTATKTTICSMSTTIIGWIWNMGTIQASPHRIATLASCEAPTTVKAMRAFVGPYKMITRVSCYGVPLYRYRRGSLKRSDNYRGIALVNSICKLVDILIIAKCQAYTHTSDLQFALKRDHSTV